MLNPPSEEQAAIVAAAAESNVIVSAVAGSGKTTTVLHIALAYPGSNILLLTYNARLKEETRERVQALGVENLETHNYHSFGIKYVGAGCETDAGLLRFMDVTTATPWQHHPPAKDIIIIDESQDMNLLYYRFARRIVEAAAVRRVIVLGDQKQNIYDKVNLTDSRFLTLADVIWGDTHQQWCRLPLSTSYRITTRIAQFINAVLGEQRLGAVKEGPAVRWHECDTFREMPKIADEIMQYAAHYGAGNIFVLAPSVRQKASNGKAAPPVITLANKLSERRLPLYIPSSDDARPSVEEMAGKLCFSSFHQVKGLERDVVIVLGMDNSYFTHYAKDTPTDTCPNTIYVAMTRAKQLLVCIKNARTPHLPFVDPAAIYTCADVIGRRDMRVAARVVRPNNDTSRSVTELVRQLPSAIMTSVGKFIDVETITRAGKKTRISQRTQSTHGGRRITENVSDINGVLAADFACVAMTGESQIRAYADKVQAHVRRNAPDCVDVYAECWQPETTGVGTAIKYAVAYDSMMTLYTHRLRQITSYSWVTAATLQKLAGKIVSAVTSRMTVDSVHSPHEFEQKVVINYLVNLRGESVPQTVLGAIDLAYHDVIWEFKCVDALSPLHILQTALYSYARADKPPGLLFNAVSGELLGVRIHEDFERLFRAIVCFTFCGGAVTDDVFLRSVGADVGLSFRFCAKCARAYGEVL